MKKWLLATVIALSSFGAYAQAPIPEFQPGPRLIDGSALNKMVAVLNSLASYSYQLVASGTNPATYTVPNGIGIVVFDVATGLITDARVTAPAAPFDGQQVAVSSKATISAFQFIANTGQTLAATTPTVLTASTTADQGYKWIYRQTDKKWYRLQ